MHACVQFMFRRLRMYASTSGNKGKVFRAYLFGHEFMILGDASVMKQMMMQVGLLMRGQREAVVVTEQWSSW